MRCGATRQAAAVWPIASAKQATAAIAALAADRMFSTADHRMTAFRVERVSQVASSFIDEMPLVHGQHRA